MKKLLKGILAAALMIFTSSAFAKDFDWSQCWCNYGANLEKSDIVLNIDGGIDSYFFTNIAYGAGYWATPYAEATLDVMLPIWKLPLSFGGYFGFSANGYNNSDANIHYNIFKINFGAEAKYHVMMPVENLDLYAGTKLGAALALGDTAIATAPIVPFDYNFIVGASYYFTKNIGVNAEFGYPVWLKVGASIKF